jgi:hypothetical protein
MKTKGFIFFLALGFMILSGAQSALAQRSSESATGGTIFDPYLVGNAQGTRLSGSLGIYYQVYQFNPATTPCGDTGPLVNMFITLRLKVGKDLKVFEGTALGICYYNSTKQIEAIQIFITNEVIPKLGLGASYQFRSVSNFVDGVIEQVCVDSYSTSFFADIEIAVR